MELGNKIKEFGDKNFDSVIDFAKAVDVSRVTLYRYFKNEILPGALFFIKMKELGCDLNWLFSSDVVREPKGEYGSNIARLKKENKELRKLVEKIKLDIDNFNEGG